MALIGTPAISGGVHNTHWQMRLKALGMTQKEFARLTGWAANTISRQMREEWPMPLYVRMMILALEKMTPEQRAEWARDGELERSDKEG